MSRYLVRGVLCALLFGMLVLNVAHSQVSIIADFPVDGEILALATDIYGNSIVAVNINQNYRIAKIDQEGTEFDVLYGWEFELEPIGMAVADNGDIYVVAVSITNNHRVVRYSADGQFIMQWVGEGIPVGIAIDANQNPQIAVNINNNFRVVTYQSP